MVYINCVKTLECVVLPILKSKRDMQSYLKSKIRFYISEVWLFHQTTLSYNGSISTITDSVSHHRLNDLNNSLAPVEYVSDAQAQNLSSMYDFKHDNRISSIRLSIFILGCLCIVLILLHVILSVITRNKILEPFFLQIEQRNDDFI